MSQSKKESLFEVYLQALIDELKDLQIDRLETNDASWNETFHIYAALINKINDFSSYVVL